MWIIGPWFDPRTRGPEGKTLHKFLYLVFEFGSNASIHSIFNLYIQNLCFIDVIIKYTNERKLICEYIYPKRGLLVTEILAKFSNLARRLFSILNVLYNKIELVIAAKTGHNVIYRPISRHVWNALPSTSRRSNSTLHTLISSVRPPDELFLYLLFSLLVLWSL